MVRIQTIAQKYRRLIILFAILIPIICVLFIYRSALLHSLGKSHGLVSTVEYKLADYVPKDYQLISSTIVISNNKKTENSEGWPSIDIVFPIVAKDAGLLIWLLNSLEIFFPHYNEIILLVEKQDLFVVRGSIPVNQGRYKIAVVNNPFVEAERIHNKHFGYIIQQWYKFYSDLCSTAEFVMVLESDLILDGKPKLEQWFEKQGEKFLPIHQLVSHESERQRLCPNGPQTCELYIWKAGAEYAYNGRDKRPSDTAATYKEANFEYMVRQPFTYPRAMFSNIRDHITKTHRKSMAQFFEHFTPGLEWRLDGKSDKLSEFNIFGHFIYTSPKWRSQFAFYETFEQHAKLNSMGAPFQHISRFRNNALPNPKLTKEYIDTALMYVHSGYCRDKPEDELCKLLPPSELKFPQRYNI